MITSIHNPKIQQVRSLLTRARNRRAEGSFVVEGVRLVEEAQASGWQASLVLYSAEVSDRGQSLVESYRNQAVQVEEVAPRVMQALSDTKNPQGILAILTIHHLPLPKPLDFALVLDEMRDPGNLGTVLRTADAAGVQATFLPPGTVDPFSPKVVRAGMGAHFRLPIVEQPWPEIQVNLEKASLRTFLAAADEGEVYYREDLRTPLALIVGGEAQGAGSIARTLADQILHIPMPGEGESLNAATAAAILLFEVARQRGQAQ